MKNFYFTALICVASACFPWPVQANFITMEMDLNYAFSGIPPESTVMPWLTARFDDHGSSGSVTITLTASHLTGTEYASEWDLNLDPALNPTQLTFDIAHASKVGVFADPDISTGVSFQAAKADGDGFYDILFGFQTSDGTSTHFDAGDSYQITVAGIPTLNANSFAYRSSTQKGQDLNDGYYSAAHVQSIGSGSNSGWIAATSVVPEPATLVLASLGMAGMMLFYQRRSKS
jgi:hypothetical protein